ncbi:MAG: hypothetical protein L7S59_01870 [Pseudomonadales bacterium]|nr:hypothetical protein [Pseudomonadales bacterium]
MTDALGFRAVFSTLIPATNAMEEPDMSRLSPAGVTNQTYRFAFPALPATAQELTQLMEPTIELALACEPDRIIIAYSPEYMTDNNAALHLRDFVAQRVPVPITLAGDTVPNALDALNLKRIGLVTPFPANANRNVANYFAMRGLTVVNQAGFASAQKGGVHSARISEQDVRDAFATVASSNADVLVQVGTALVCAGFVAELEAEHKKPVIAVNSATYWLALRQHGITDQFGGYGKLFTDY